MRSAHAGSERRELEHRRCRNEADAKAAGDRGRVLRLAQRWHELWKAEAGDSAILATVPGPPQRSGSRYRC